MSRAEIAEGKSAISRTVISLDIQAKDERRI